MTSVAQFDGDVAHILPSASSLSLLCSALPFSALLFTQFSFARNAVPFRQGKSRKIPIAIGLTTFLVTGFSLPFVAAAFQL